MNSEAIAQFFEPKADVEADLPLPDGYSKKGMWHLRMICGEGILLPRDFFFDDSAALCLLDWLPKKEVIFTMTINANCEPMVTCRIEYMERPQFFLGMGDRISQAVTMAVRGYIYEYQKRKTT